MMNIRNNHWSDFFWKSPLSALIPLRGSSIKFHPLHVVDDSIKGESLHLLIVKTIVLLSLALAFPWTVCASETVHISIVGPMGGTSASVGMQYKVGVSAALLRLPDGKLLGHSVKTDLFDDNCDTAIAEAVARQIVENPPAVVIGHSCSSATIAAAPIYADHKVLQISPASTNPKVTGMGIDTIFRMIGRDDIQGKIAAKRIAEKHAGQKVGVLFFPQSYSEILSKSAIAELERRGITPVALVQAKGSESSYADEIEELINKGVEVLYLVGGGLDSGVFLRQARQMEANFAVISSDTLVSRVFQKTAGDAANGVPFTFPPEAVELTSAAEAVEAVKTMGDDPAGYTLLAYAAAQVWIEGVTRAQSFNADKVSEAIRLKPVPTILGDVAFDKYGDIITSYTPFAWYVWKDGQRVSTD
jgi:branched-chain amino acid transport system substrate-binding protein